MLPCLKGLLMGGFISRLTYESYHYAQSREMTEVARVKHGTCVRYLGPIDRYMMYTDNDFGITHTFQPH